MGLSKQAYNFIGGVMHSAEALTAWFNPTINSYKRINAPVTDSGATWSPNTITYSGNNRTHMIRIPGSGRFELRLMDGAVNPYLLQAGIIAAGIDGMKYNRKPGKPIHVNMYEESHKVKNAKKLPKTLDSALSNLNNSKMMQRAFTKSTIDSYVKLRTREIKQFKSSNDSKKKGITNWEKNNTLDC